MFSNIVEYEKVGGLVENKSFFKFPKLVSYSEYMFLIYELRFLHLNPTANRRKALWSLLIISDSILLGLILAILFIVRIFVYKSKKKSPHDEKDIKQGNLSNFFNKFE